MSTNNVQIDFLAAPGVETDDDSTLSVDELSPLIVGAEGNIESLWKGDNGLVLGILCVSIFITYLPESLLQPFFPLYSATELGFSHTQIAIILSLPPLFGAMFTPLAANLCMKFGRAQVWMSGALLMVITMAIFGFTSSFYIMCVIRISQGLCVSLVNVSTQSIVTAVFRSQKATAMSAYQTSMTLAFTLGPTLGGLLFDLLGFEMLFVANAVIALIPLIGSTYLYLTLRDMVVGSVVSQSSHVPFRSVLTIPTLIGATAWALLYSGFAFETLLQEHLFLTLRLNPTAVGMTIFFQSVTTVLIVKPIGEYTDTHDARFLIPLAFILAAVYWLAAGPFLSLLDPNWWVMLVINCMIMVTQGICVAMLLPTTYSYLAFQVMKDGIDGTEEQVAQIMVFLEGMGFTVSTIAAGWLMTVLPKDPAPGCTLAPHKCYTAFSTVTIIYGSIFLAAALFFYKTIFATDYHSQLTPKHSAKHALQRMSSLRFSSTANVFNSLSPRGVQSSRELVKVA